MQQNMPHQFYTSNVTEYTHQLLALKKRSSWIAWIRFAIFLTTAFAIYFLWESNSITLISIAFVGIGVFLWLLSLSANNKKQQEHLTLLIQLNEEEIQILHHNYLTRADGTEFINMQHAYANDLDIFGKASLYQYLNRCTSEQGKLLLANRLLKAQTTEAILLQQAAVKELSTNTNWMQHFSALGLSSPLKISTQEKITNWLQQPQTTFLWGGWKWFVQSYSLITISTLILHIVGIIPAALFYPLTTVYFLFALFQSKKVHTTYLLLGKVVNEVATLFEQLKWIEQASFKNSHFNQLQQLLQANNTKSSIEILALKNILDRFDMRLNVFVFFFLNSFLLWDVRQMIALNKWKRKNQHQIEAWMEVIASTEVTISLATLSFNQPEFSFPTISTQYFEFSATNLGHPLIQQSKRINNCFTQTGIGNIALITGSNMGGKSTFLRSIGTNTVLALMGAPVCATTFTISNIELMSSMRIADNLAESTSTFYAELKKLQTIIEAVKQERQVFILLDEILRGTNSLDRHTGSKALIQQFIEQQTVAIIATHDVELAQLQQQFPTAISNYHFDVQVANEELYFDYKLKDGICKSLNASILMKKIGIQIQ
jgi:hypothetical protein